MSDLSPPQEIIVIDDPSPPPKLKSRKVAVETYTDDDETDDEVEVISVYSIEDDDSVPVTEGTPSLIPLPVMVSVPEHNNGLVQEGAKQDEVQHHQVQSHTRNGHHVQSHPRRNPKKDPMRRRKTKPNLPLGTSEMKDPGILSTL